METAVLGGLVVGSIYVLVALGYNVALLASGAFNFAQAAVVMFGTFIAYQFGVLDGLPLPLVLAVGAAAGALVGILIEIVAIRPVQGRGVHGELVTTVGASIVLEGVAVLTWGDQALPLNAVVSSRVVSIGGGRVSIDGLVIIGFALVVFLALWTWSRRTLGGLACLAASEDRTAASLRGVNVRLMSILALAFAGALGGLAGPIVGTATFAVVTLGTAITLKAFLALAIGGFGSFPGAAVGGLLVGLIESLTSRYAGADWAAIVLFALLLATLTVKPSGLFGQRRERLV